MTTNNKENWQQTSLFMKVIRIIGIILSVLIIIFAVLQIFNVMQNAGYIYLPLIGLLMITQAIQNWKTSKGVAIFSIFVAAFDFAVVIICFLI